jgi:hypothetical protein
MVAIQPVILIVISITLQQLIQGVLILVPYYRYDRLVSRSALNLSVLSFLLPNLRIVMQVHQLYRQPGLITMPFSLTEMIYLLDLQITL